MICTLPKNLSGGSKPDYTLISPSWHADIKLPFKAHCLQICLHFNLINLSQNSWVRRKMLVEEKEGYNTPIITLIINALNR